MRIALGMAMCLIAGALAAQTFEPGGPLVFRDSQNRLVGQVIDASVVSVVINGHITLLVVLRPILTDFGSGLLFDQANCQGNAYIDMASARSLPFTPAVFAPDGTVRISPSLQATSRTVNSRFTDVSQQCVNQTLTIMALDTEVGPNLKAMFQSPFSMQPGSVSSPSVMSNVPANSMVWLGALLAVLGVAAVLRLK